MVLLTIYSLQRLVSEYLSWGDLNVVVLDWVRGGAPPYTQACANTRLLGDVLAHFIRILHVSRSVCVCVCVCVCTQLLLKFEQSNHSRLDFVIYF